MTLKSIGLLLAVFAFTTPAIALPSPQWWSPPPPPPPTQWKPPPPPAWQPPPPPAWQPPPPPAWQPPPPGSNPNYCPVACNVFYNNCDEATAPVCSYPNPSVPRPRSACACRLGYKASGYADDDSSKHWRLPVRDQEHRVWVAEGVKCDTRCQGTGTGACQEVSMLGEQCIGGAP